MAIERELKFALDAASVARVWRAFAGAAKPRRRQVRTIYFDTADAVLRKARASLRLRRAGGVWLQTFKSAGSFAARGEWETRVAAERFEPERFPLAEIKAASGIDLAKLVPALRPLFSTDFVRTSAQISPEPTLEIELSVDRGWIVSRRRRLPLLELEAELKRGDAIGLLRFGERVAGELGLRLLFPSKAERGYLLASTGGGRPGPAKAGSVELVRRMSADDAFVGIVGSAIQQIGANAAGVLAARDPEYLHQMRVGMRRLRAALSAFRSIVPREHSGRLRGWLQSFAPALGQARDLDVLVQVLDARILPGFAGEPGVLRVLRAARRRRAAAWRQARERVGAADFQLGLLQAEEWLQARGWRESPAAPAPTTQEVAGKVLRRFWNRTTAICSDVSALDATLRHRLRVRIKRLRYASDFFSAVRQAKAFRRFRSRLEAMQEILGELNDLAVACRWLSSVETDAGGKRLVLGWLKGRESRLLEELPAAWQALRASDPF